MFEIHNYGAATVRERHGTLAGSDAPDGRGSVAFIKFFPPNHQ
jgi:hypothetical protein